jgi:hypothetical protein
VLEEVRDRNNTISETFENSKERSVFWVEKEFCKSILQVRQSSRRFGTCMASIEYIGGDGGMEESNSLRFQVFVYSIPRRNGPRI